MKKLFNKKASNPRVETVHGLERLYLRNHSDTVVVVAYDGKNERKICDLTEYENGQVIVEKNGKRVMLTLQSVSR